MVKGQDPDVIMSRFYNPSTDRGYPQKPSIEIPTENASQKGAFRVGLVVGRYKRSGFLLNRPRFQF
jgi:hypothetical protein